MAKISDTELAALKSIPLLTLIQDCGVTLQKRGQNHIGHCPFHNDKTPSLIVTESKNLWNCLGACSQGGSPIDWVMKHQRQSFLEACETLRLYKRHGRIFHREYLITGDNNHTEARKRTISHYHQTLKQSPNAQEYLSKRGINDPDAIETFQIGYSDRSLSKHIPFAKTHEGTRARKRLWGAGLLKESGHELFRGCITFPIIDEKGEVQHIYGRRIRERRGYDGPQSNNHMYRPGPHKGVWNKPAIQKDKPLILCESIIDALNFWCQGYKNVTTSYGTNGFTDDIFGALKENPPHPLYIAYDPDEAGNIAAQKVAEKLAKENIECRRIRFPKTLDANDFITRVKPAAKNIELLLNAAEPMAYVKETPTKPEAPILAAPSKPKDPQPEPQKENPTPQTPQESKPLKITDTELHITLGERKWRARGIQHIRPESLRINLLVSQGKLFHVDSLDLYNAKHRASFIRETAAELGIPASTIKNEIGQILLKLEDIQSGQEEKPKAYEMTPKEKEEALKLLKSPNLLQKIQEDFQSCGIVGEEINTLIGYIAATSRKLENPLAILVQSSSAAGKSSLMEAVLQLMPKEELVQFSAMTGQSLFYLGETDIKHKILAIVEEEGALKAAYALKLLQSEGELSIASTGKDPGSGRMVTHHYNVEGPIMLFLTTTAIDIDEELLNRCMVLTVNESREQTQAIHRLQRQNQTLEGLLKTKAKADILKRHQNAQRLLRPLLVANPFADSLTFEDGQTRTRRDHMKYLTLIRSIALLHQYQRKVKTIEHHGQAVEYIEVTEEDIKTADHLSAIILKRSMDDLPPQTRKLLEQITDMVNSACKDDPENRSYFRFSRRDVHEHTGVGHTQLRIHMGRLESCEYIQSHRAPHSRRFLYQLVTPGMETEGVRAIMRGVKGGKNGASSGDARGIIGPLSGGQNQPKSKKEKENPDEVSGFSKRTLEQNPSAHTPLAHTPKAKLENSTAAKPAPIALAGGL